jgi:hypothetical protein
VTGHRLNVAWIRRIVAELLANFLDALGEGAIAHDDVAPYLLEELLFPDKRAALSYQ